MGFTELTPHWLVSGRSDAGRAAFLTTALLGLTARYGPDELALYLVDLGDGESFVEFLQTERDRSWLPQVRAAGMAADPEYVRDLFDQLAAEIHRREEAAARAGGQRFAQLRDHQVLPRVVCVIDNFPLLLSDRDRWPPRCWPGWTGWPGRGAAYGVHLVLAGAGDLGVGAGSAPRDSVLGQFPVRVALAGGSAVLMPTNDAAAGLAVGSAVVNTAGGLGGPRGATRGHERLVRFPDPHDAPEVVERLRHACGRRGRRGPYRRWSSPGGPGRCCATIRGSGCRRRAVRRSGGPAGSGGGRRPDDGGGAVGAGGGAQPRGPRAGPGGGDAAGDGRPEHRRAPSAGQRAVRDRHRWPRGPPRWPTRSPPSWATRHRVSTVDRPGLLTAAPADDPDLPGGVRAGRACGRRSCRRTGCALCCGRVHRQAGTCSAGGGRCRRSPALVEPEGEVESWPRSLRWTCRARSSPRSSASRCSGVPARTGGALGRPGRAGHGAGAVRR